MIVEFSPRATQDLIGIRDYIANDIRRAAERVVSRIMSAIRQLEAFPELGPRWRASATRELVVASVPYRVHYQLTDSAVQIIAMTHTSRILELWSRREGVAAFWLSRRRPPWTLVQAGGRCAHGPGWS